MQKSIFLQKYKWLILTAVLVVGVLAGLQYYVMKSSDPVMVVKEFYNSHIQSINKRENTTSAEYLRNLALTENFRNELISSYADEGPGHDLVLCAQDAPDNGDSMEVKLLSQQAQTANVRLSKLFSNVDHSIDIELISTDNDWQINNIVCPALSQPTNSGRQDQRQNFVLSQFVLRKKVSYTCISEAWGKFAAYGNIAAIWPTEDGQKGSVGNWEVKGDTLFISNAGPLNGEYTNFHYITENGKTTAFQYLDACGLEIGQEFSEGSYPPGDIEKALNNFEILD
jgi:hypothetical protein